MCEKNLADKHFNFAKLFSVFFSDGTFIIGNRGISLTRTDLTEFPLFLRFNNVQLWYWRGSQPIKEKCELIEAHLIPFKSVLNVSNMIEFYAYITHDDKTYFNNHSKLLYYLQNRLLQICDSARGYKFRILFFSHANTITNVIESILQMPPIERCSNVEIEIPFLWRVQKQLPVKAISNWLEMSAVRMEINDRKQKEKFLKILMMGIQNARELIDHLKMVYL